MTALISWAAACGHGIASLYLATDSRMCLLYPDQTLKPTRDDFQKTFASPYTPDIFAVCGKVRDLNRLIKQLVFLALEDRNSLGGTAASDEYTSRLLAKIPEPNIFSGMTLFHGFRFQTNDFGLYRVELGKKPTTTKIQITIQSGLLYLDGSGEKMVQRSRLEDPETDSRGFSRWYWQSFVHSLNPSTDRTCGGAPQLVGLFQKGCGISFGVRFNGQTYLSGHLAEKMEILHVRDELFQRTLPSGELLKGAQRHARNFPGVRLFGR